MKTELARRRWRAFSSRKRALIALVVFCLVFFLSLTAEFWCNSRPLALKWQGQWYFPVVQKIHPETFEQADRLVTDYRTLSLSENDFVLWPPVVWDPFETNDKVESFPSPPTNVNWLGTDESGRDVLTRLLYGFRYSMAYAIIVWILSTALGVIAGALMGYQGGLMDLVGQRAVEIISSVPVLFLLIILVSIFEPGLFMLIVLTSVFGWISMSYYTRAEFLKLRKREFVEACRAMGGSQARVIFRHILPNSLVPVITFAPFVIAGHVYGLAALDYLGFGLPPPTPSWGELLHQAQKYFTTAWWLAVYPSVALFMTLILLALVGEGVRAAWDPSQS